MRPALEPDHDLYASEAPADLVLGAPALLGIFFAIAVVCAVCFGFGYSARSSLPQTRVTTAHSAGHIPRPLGPSPSSTRQDTDAENENGDAPGELSGLPPEPDHTGGVALTQAKPKPTPAVHLGTRLATAQPDTLGEASIGTASVPSVKSYPAPVPLHAPLITPSIANVPVPGGSALLEGLMVQIAAVSRAADAQTLAAALRHDGFDAIVRSATGDPLFHVQVGPFATQEAAKAMRTRLADNGYNAFIRN